MANPQKENGYTAIANEIAEKFCQYRLSGEEWLVLWVILRKTYGWNKKEDTISLSQFALKTGMKKSSIIRAIHKLVAKKLLLINKNATSIGNIYSFNKNFDKWKPFTKKLMGVAKKLTTVSKKANGGVAKKLHTKTTYTKTTITKTNNIESGEKILKTPAQIAREFFNNQKTQQKLINQLVKKYNINPLFIKNEINKFISYWTEPNKSGTKQRWEQQTTFEIARRLTTWFNNIKKFNKSKGIIL